MTLKLNIIETIAFPDHYAYRAKDIEMLKRKAQEQNAVLITTEKDFVRIAPTQNKNIKTLPITLEFNDTKALIAFIKRGIKS